MSDIIRRGGHWVLRQEFTADECESIAAALSASDAWGDELLRAADRIRELEAEDTRHE